MNFCTGGMFTNNYVSVMIRIMLRIQEILHEFFIIARYRQLCEFCLQLQK